MQDLTAILPNGKSFVFWEKDAIYDRELIVDASAAECGDGSASKPFRTINEAAAIATPGTGRYMAFAPPTWRYSGMPSAFAPAFRMAAETAATALPPSSSLASGQMESIARSAVC